MGKTAAYRLSMLNYCDATALC